MSRRITVQTFVLMTKLAPDASKHFRDQAKQGRLWLEKVNEKCPEVNFIAHYALLGPCQQPPAKAGSLSLALHSQEQVHPRQ